MFMKANIHPTYHEDTLVTCRSCGTTFTTGSILKSLTMEVCNKCHPFYTGEQRFLDTRGRVEKFTKRMEDSKQYVDQLKKKKQKKHEKEEKKAKSLAELLGEM